MNIDERRHIVLTTGNPGMWILFADPRAEPQPITPHAGDVVHHNISAIDYQADLNARGLRAFGCDWWVREVRKALS